MNKVTENQIKEFPISKEEKERVALLYEHGGLPELDYDYYQGECPE